MGSGSLIQSVTAREVFTGRGHPGIEAAVITENGSRGVAMATAGLSVGKHEVQFVYDGGSRWEGLGVLRAVRNVQEIIAPALKGADATKQRKIDGLLVELDGTPNRAKLGGNATASVSAAVLQAGAASLGIPLYQHIGGVNACLLPVPCAGSFSGCGRYGGGPPGSSTGDKPSHSFPCYGFDSFAEASYAGWEISRQFGRILSERFNAGSRVLGYSGIAPGVVSHDRELWDAMAEAIERAGYASRAGIQIDVAAGTYYDEERGVFTGLFSKEDKTREELIELYREMVKSYPVVILEDPLGEEDYEGHAILARELGIEIVGDDLFTTNPVRLQQGIEVGGANAMLLKVNQVGTISEAFDAVQMAYRAGYGVMPCSSRGEGVALADYVVGLRTGHLRGGALGPMANRFLEIEAELGDRAQFPGADALRVDWPK
jgi:enolase